MTRTLMMNFLNWNAVTRGVATLVLASVVACDLEVASPNRVEEANLDDPGLIETMLRGAEGDFAHAASGQAGFGGMFMAGALLTDEWVHAGLMPGLRNFSDGTPIDPNHTEVNEIWAYASQARYTSEELVARINRLMQLHADSADLVQTLTNQLALANLWAGFANRAMGDTFCNAVIDGGPLQPRTVYYDRALPYFTKAIELFTAGATGGGEEAVDSPQLWASYGGRAQTYLAMGRYAEADADALMWTRSALFTHRHANWAGRPREWNFLFRSNLFAHTETTVWGTPWVSPLVSPATQGTPTPPPGVGRNIQTTTTAAQGDPRIKYDTPTSPNVGADGRRPFWRQRKYVSSSGVGVVVASWDEMKLIQAEHRLRNGDINGMLDMIDTVRRRWGVDSSAAGAISPLRPSIPTGVNADSAAWAILIRERGLSTWLEGRRLPDMRRWRNDPETMWSRRLLELPQGPFTVVRRATGATPAGDERLPVLQVQHEMCVPVSGHERRTNPNIPNS